MNHQYNSYATTKQYRFAQSNPKSYDFSSDDTAVTINNKIVRLKDWFQSRTSHKRMARKRSLTTLHNLESLLSSLDHLIIFNGNFRLPDATSDEWRKVKKKFSEARRYWERKTGFRLAIIAKIHITQNRHDDSEWADDCHYDYLAWTDANMSQRNLSHLINTWWKKAGGTSVTAKIIDDVSPENLSRVCNYCFKYPDTRDSNFLFERYHFLPLQRKQSGMSVTWNCGKFFQHPEKEITTEYELDGEPKTKVIKAPFELNWHSWKVKTFTESKCVIKTAGYRLEQVAKVLLKNSSDVTCPIKSIGKKTEKHDWLLTHKTPSKPVDYLTLLNIKQQYGLARVAQVEKQDGKQYYAIMLHKRFLTDDGGKLVMFDSQNLKEFAIWSGVKPPERLIDARKVWFVIERSGDNPSPDTTSTAMSM